MELIQFLTVIAFLSKHSIATYMKTTTSGAWTDMRNECTLATPAIMYSAEELTADIGTDIELNDTEKLWVGYIEDFEIYHFHGCIDQNSLADRHVLADRYAPDKKAAVGLCYSACPDTKFFGVTENKEKKTLCHCINQGNLNNVRNRLTSCNSSGDEGFAFGRGQFLAVYESVSTNLSKRLKNLDTWKEMNGSCLRNFNPSEQIFQWSQCNLFHNVLCANSSGQASFIEANIPWKRAVDYCFAKSAFPFPYQSSRFSSNSTLQYWLANVRSMTITEDTGQTTFRHTKYGYIVREKGKLILRFEGRENNLKGLCSEDTTDLYRRVDGSSENSNGNLGVYVGVTVVVVLAVILVGTVLLLKRKRNASLEKVDNKRRSLTYESNAQPNQNINAHRPDSADVYHEIQDVTESINEEYDTIPDGCLQKSTQNSNTEVGHFVLEKHTNADYEFARDVNGEREHVYDRKPIGIATAITDDYDHIGKGNTNLKQSLEDQPYDTTSHVKPEHQDPTYYHTGDHTTYDHTWKHTANEHSGNHITYDHTGDHTTYDHTGNHTTYEHTGDNADYDHTGDHSAYDHTWDHTAYHHTGEHTTYDHTGGNAN